MSPMRDWAAPPVRAGDDRKPRAPISMLAAIRQAFYAGRGRRALARTVRTGPGCRPAVPTFFAFDVLDLIGDVRTGQRREGRATFSGEFTIVLTLSLLGLALGLLEIGRVGVIDPEYMATLLSLF